MSIIKTILFLSISSLFFGCGGGSTTEFSNNLIQNEPDKQNIMDDKQPKTEPIPIINNRPTALIENKPIEKIVRENGISIEFMGIGDDIDNDILSFEWRDNGKVIATTQKLIKDNFSTGEHNLTFTVTDTKGGTASDMITITILPSNKTNDAPTAKDQNIITDEDNPVSFQLKVNDIEGDDLLLNILTQPEHGKLSGNMPNFTYTPNKNFRGSDKIVYVVNDGNSNSNQATLYIKVNRINDAPIVKAMDDYTMRLGYTNWLTAEANDSDGFIKSYKWSENGKILSTKPSFRYTPDTLGVHNIEITVTDNEDLSSTDRVLVNVTNKLPLIVIRIEFNNYKFHSSSTTWSNKIFGTNQGELNHYYNEISYGRLQFEKAKESQENIDDGVITVNLDINHPGNSKNFIYKDAINLADQYIDFSQYDIDKNGAISSQELQIMFLVAGGENATGLYPGIWAHATSMDTLIVLDNVKLMDFQTYGTYSAFGESHFEFGEDATIGIIAHELGHSALGLVDLYDTDGSSQGIGNFGLMGSGNWGRSSRDERPGTTPVHMCAWNKIESKFIEPIEITNSKSIELIESSSTNFTLYKIPTIHKNEYFLLENRQNSGYDRGLYILKDGYNFNGGLMITHIDENIDKYEIANDNETHKLVDIEEANNPVLDTNESGRGDIKNLYFSGNKDKFTSKTSPNSNLYDGTNSGINITNISDSSASMSADIDIQ